MYTLGECSSVRLIQGVCLIQVLLTVNKGTDEFWDFCYCLLNKGCLLILCLKGVFHGSVHVQAYQLLPFKKKMLTCTSQYFSSKLFSTDYTENVDIENHHWKRTVFDSSEIVINNYSNIVDVLGRTQDTWK